MPRFEVFFASLHAKLPLVTRMLLSTTAFMGKWWYAEIAFVIIVVGGFIATNRSPGGKARLDAIKLKLPVIGTSRRRRSLSVPVGFCLDAARRGGFAPLNGRYR